LDIITNIHNLRHHIKGHPQDSTTGHGLDHYKPSL
jgi:ribosomal protein S15P/S13E